MSGKRVLFRNFDSIMTLAGAEAKDGRRVLEADLGLIAKASLVCEDGRVAWVGPHRRLPAAWARDRAMTVVEGEGRLLCPGFVECHTHLIHAGVRADEFEWRLNGIDYAEIARRGGGILSTMKATRKSSLDQLVESGQERVDRFLAQGATTIEMKSGYGLNVKDELKLLRAAGRLKGAHVVRTFLGAHAQPPEHADVDSYLTHLEQKILPIIAREKLAERVDIFVENGFFPADRARLHLQRAKDLGLEVVVHADQLTLSGGTDLAIALSARSADHVIQIGATQVEALARSQVTAVLLPAADLYMRCAYPPGRKLVDAGARIAVATDFNPGTSPAQDLMLTGLLARLHMNLTLPETIAAYTVGAAAALGLAGTRGVLKVGASADLFSTTRDWTEFFYRAGESLPDQVYVGGRRWRPSSKKRGIKKI